MSLLLVEKEPREEYVANLVAKYALKRDNEKELPWFVLEGLLFGNEQ